ncbi:gelsolin, cytoplasmic-like [Leguminivora glycinivorella]|uniref:gelsolin, cytoplasmic-like n=1 Tax=Leguminivora glycinivorella TaxID=1035111 RepID=UPI0020106A87|nr:gelsolin, cytoplasmic-like [Leguminivora glycinivorella]
MDHPAFAEAGAVAGIEIWTIQKFEPVPIEKKMYGKFYNADSYIVLKTTGDGQSAYSYDAHFWLGTKTTQDKKGSAAIWTVTLDDMLGGRAVHHREVQGHETGQFLGYFKPAIRYLEGGNDSGFNEVETNAGAEKRLLRLSGCDNMRIEEVPAEASSLTKDQCFILENEHDIFVLMPEGAKATQRRKIISVANSLRDDYHNGRATIEIIDEFSSDEDVALFFETLGSGSKDDIADDSTEETYTRDGSMIFLYKVLAGDELELVAVNKPYKQKYLTSDAIFILDTPCSGVFLWLGSDVHADSKKNYNDVAQKYLEIKGYPSWVPVTRVSEGAECSTFRQFFSNWDTVGTGYSSVRTYVSELDAGYYSGDAEESAASAKLIGKSAAARGYMPDLGAGNLEAVFRLAGGENEDITEKMAESPIMYSSDCYVVKYQCNEESDGKYVIYWWIGKDASTDDKKAARDLATDLEIELDETVTVVKVPHGKEPKHFLSIFHGNLSILYGGKEFDYALIDSGKRTFDDEDSDYRLFRAQGTTEGVDTRFVQVFESLDTFQDDGVFALETRDTVYCWYGKDAFPLEREFGARCAQKLAEGKEYLEVEQGEEPDQFWDALRGIGEEKEDPSGWTLEVNRRVTSPTTLTTVSVSVTGKIKFEELPLDYKQEDLSDDGIYVLDTGEELYLWQGKNIPERVKSARNQIIEEYIADDGLDRTVDSAIVVTVKQGSEPKVFKKLFPSWEDDMWDNQTSYEDLKNEAKAANSK